MNTLDTITKKITLAANILAAIDNRFRGYDDLPAVYELGINPESLDVLAYDAEADGIGGWWDLPDGYGYASLVDLEPETVEALVLAIIGE